MGISNITGPPVEGENFFGRERELASALNHIKKGNSIILSAPRRVGKSSFAKKLIAIAAAEEWRTLEIDLEEIGSEQKFLEIFVEKLRNASWWNKTASTASDIINHILENTKITIKETATIEWKAKRADLFTRLGKLLNHEDETLIMIDEVTVLLNRFINIDKENGRENVSFFLYWLRNLRQVSETKIRWIFCSSIGIDNFTSRHNLSSTFNDVFSFPIGPFDELTTKALLRKLADSDQFLIPDDLIEQIVSRIGWCLPYFIQVIYFHFHNLSINRKETNSVENIDEAFRELIESKELNT